MKELLNEQTKTLGEILKKYTFPTPQQGNGSGAEQQQSGAPPPAALVAPPPAGVNTAGVPPPTADDISELEKLCKNQWSSMNLGTAKPSWNEAVTQISAYSQGTVIDLAKKAGLTWTEADFRRNSRTDIAKALKTALKQYLRSQSSTGANGAA